MNFSSFFRLLPRSVRHRIKCWLNPSYRSENEEKNRLRKLPRYIKGTTSIIDPAIQFVDAASFLSAYEQIFENEIYDFNVNHKNPTIIDCGANIGLAIRYWKRKYPKAEITAFEPDPAVYKVLCSNVERCGYTDVSLIPKGVWSYEGTRDFYQEGADAGFITDKEKETEKKKNIISIPVVRLRDYLGKPVDMLKIDIEGSEIEVLNDCHSMLDSVENLFVEYHSYLGKEQRLDELLGVIRKAGFRFHIQPELVALRPFVQQLKKNGMDNRLNIFAYRR